LSDTKIQAADSKAYKNLNRQASKLNTAKRIVLWEYYCCNE